MAISCRAGERARRGSASGCVHLGVFTFKEVEMTAEALEEVHAGGQAAKTVSTQSPP
jgi:hypothetical protein